MNFEDPSRQSLKNVRKLSLALMVSTGTTGISFAIRVSPPARAMEPRGPRLTVTHETRFESTSNMAVKEKRRDPW